MSTQTLQKIEDLIAPWIDEFESKKEPAHQVRLADDPIALSWASYHVWLKSPARRWVSLDDVEAHDHDRRIAFATRRYYRDRLALLALKGKELTKFQSALYALVSNESPLMSDQVGMVMKLPYFYVEDTTQDEIFSTSTAIPSGKNRPSRMMQRASTITPWARYLMSRKSQECYCYWFQDDQGYPVMWAVGTNNNLRSLVDSLYYRNRPINIRANWHLQRRSSDRDQLFYHLANVELV